MNCTCENSAEWISAWLDGALTPLEERMLMAHLEQCPDCAVVFEQFTALNAAFSELEEFPAPEGFAQGVMERIRAEAPPAPAAPKVVPLFRRPAVRAFVGVAACAVLCFGLTRMSGGDFAQSMDAAIPEAAMESSVMTLESAPEAAEGAPSGSVQTVPEAAPTEPAADSVVGAVQEPRTPASTECETEKPEIPIDVYPIPLPLPEGSEAILGDAVEWYPDENDRMCCNLTEEQARQLMKLAAEQNMDVQIVPTSDPNVWTLHLPA